MALPAVRVENLSKRYRLGLIGRTALHEDLSRWWARLRGQPDPTMRIDQLQRLEAKKAEARELHDDAEHIWALRDMNFEVEQGEVLGIIGKNGAGKSTLLKILSRVTAPTLGCIKVKGRIASLLEVGTGFHPELTGRENVYLNGAILGMNKAEVRQKFDEIVAFAELETFIDTPVKRYSSGMYVRLAFAVAAHLDPEILVVDEVLAVGDVEFQKKCLGKMKDVAGHGRTVLFVSHNMASIRQLCSRVIVLSDGTVVKDGETNDGIEFYLGQFDKLRTVYDLRDWPRQSFLPVTIRMNKLELLSENGGPVLGTNERLCFRLTATGASYLEEITVGLSLKSYDGSPLAHVYSNTPVTFPAGETVTFGLTVEGLGLAPGHYSCVVSLGQGDEYTGRRDIDLVTEVLAFEVLPPEDAEGRSARWSAIWGPVRLPQPQVTVCPTDSDYAGHD